jgi:hypothetical protein
MPRLHGYREFLAKTEERITDPSGDWIPVQHLPDDPVAPPHDDFPVARVVRWSGKR